MTGPSFFVRTPSRSSTFTNETEASTSYDDDDNTTFRVMSPLFFTLDSWFFDSNDARRLDQNSQSRSQSSGTNSAFHIVPDLTYETRSEMSTGCSSLRPIAEVRFDEDTTYASQSFDEKHSDCSSECSGSIIFEDVDEDEEEEYASRSISGRLFDDLSIFEEPFYEEEKSVPAFRTTVKSSTTPISKERQAPSNSKQKKIQKLVSPKKPKFVTRSTMTEPIFQERVITPSPHVMKALFENGPFVNKMDDKQQVTKAAKQQVPKKVETSTAPRRMPIAPKSTPSRRSTIHVIDPTLSWPNNIILSDTLKSNSSEEIVFSSGDDEEESAVKVIEEGNVSAQGYEMQLESPRSSSLALGSHSRSVSSSADITPNAPPPPPPQPKRKKKGIMSFLPWRKSKHSKTAAAACRPKHRIKEPAEVAQVKSTTSTIASSSTTSTSVPDMYQITEPVDVGCAPPSRRKFMSPKFPKSKIPQPSHSYRRKNLHSKASTMPIATLTSRKTSPEKRCDKPLQTKQVPPPTGRPQEQSQQAFSKAAKPTHINRVDQQKLHTKQQKTKQEHGAPPKKPTLDSSCTIKPLTTKKSRVSAVRPSSSILSSPSRPTTKPIQSRSTKMFASPSPRSTRRSSRAAAKLIAPPPPPPPPPARRSSRPTSARSALPPPPPPARTRPRHPNSRQSQSSLASDALRRYDFRRSSRPLNLDEVIHSPYKRHEHGNEKEEDNVTVLLSVSQFG